MISVKYPSIIAVAAFVAGSFVASPELRAFAANTVGSADIINNSIQSVDIKDGEVKAADIATDAVGAAEIQGVTKLLFGQCMYTDAEKSQSILAEHLLSKNCKITGVDSDDNAFATLNDSGGCFVVSLVIPSTDVVSVSVKNTCAFTQTVGSFANIAVLVYDK